MASIVSDACGRSAPGRDFQPARIRARGHTWRHITDVFGGGYYSEILSGIVGPGGQVLPVNGAPYDSYAKTR